MPPVDQIPRRVCVGHAFLPKLLWQNLACAGLGNSAEIVVQRGVGGAECLHDLPATCCDVQAGRDPMRVVRVTEEALVDAGVLNAGRKVLPLLSKTNHFAARVARPNGAMKVQRRLDSCECVLKSLSFGSRLALDVRGADLDVNGVCRPIGHLEYQRDVPTVVRAESADNCRLTGVRVWVASVSCWTLP